MIGRLFCLSLTVLGLSAIDACSDGFVESGNACFHVEVMNVNWAEAKIYCEAMKAKLATIDSASKAQSVQQYMDTVKGASELTWIDGSDLYTEGEWFWMDSQKIFTYTNWIPGQPDNGGGTEHCAHLNKRYGYKWNDHDCTVKLNFLCERPLSLTPH
ncbi:perlucin-like [Haliotis rufescens]|uniref:perlucin-like n=1 Tax=Haliotis rufescens TaxID=6454 RepID=UPI00201F7933|nr:perlucin-like [Haliotis rufescens]